MKLYGARSRNERLCDETSGIMRRMYRNMDVAARERERDITMV